MSKTFKVKKKLTIGVFDSGLGGLTVLKYLLKTFPGTNFIYLGDLENLPYGNKSTGRVTECSFKCYDFLKKQNVDAIVIACNTASSCAYKKIKDEASIPVFDVISPCVKEISQAKDLKVVILGTEKTISSNIYSELIKEKNPKAKIINIACPLFVPIVEEGLNNTSLADMAIKHYLGKIQSEKINKLILGCTHYPILLPRMKKFLGESVDIMDSGSQVAKSIIHKVSINKYKETSSILYYVTDLPERFKKYGSMFLGREINKVNIVKI